MQKYKLTKSNKFILFAIIFSTVVFFISCDRAKEKVEDASKTVKETAEKTMDKVAETTDSVVNKTADKIEDAAQKAKKVVESKPLLGVWVGKFDSRVTTLTITSENENEITGKISISYRNPINQDLKGRYNSDTKTLTMEDQLHSRYMGKYTGKISENEKVYTGTFTTNVDKKTVNFKLTKK